MNTRAGALHHCYERRRRRSPAPAANNINAKTDNIHVELDEPVAGNESVCSGVDEDTNTVPRVDKVSLGPLSLAAVTTN